MYQYWYFKWILTPYCLTGQEITKWFPWSYSILDVMFCGFEVFLYISHCTHNDRLYAITLTTWTLFISSTSFIDSLRLTGEIVPPTNHVIFVYTLSKVNLQFINHTLITVNASWNVSTFDHTVGEELCTYKNLDTWKYAPTFIIYLYQ